MSYRLDERLRNELKKPLGTLVEDSSVDLKVKELVNSTVISVGDRTTERLKENGIKPKIEIVDGMEKRKSRLLPEDGVDIKISAKNPQGTITYDSMEAIKCAVKINRRTRIIIEGEEDLLAIPCIINAEDGWVVAYGQPNEGMVLVKVDDSAKRLAKSYLSRMLH